MLTFKYLSDFFQVFNFTTKNLTKFIHFLKKGFLKCLYLLICNLAFDWAE